jgi:hypothetical protein
MARFIELTMLDGNAMLVNADAVTMVQTSGPALGMNPAGRAVVTIGNQPIAVKETVAEVKALL